MRRTLAVLGLAGLIAAGTASASTVLLNAGTIQASTASSVSCDTAINTNWGLETDDNSVRSVRFVDIAQACVGADLFVEIFDEDDNLIFKSSKPVAADNVSFSLGSGTAPNVTYPTPQSIGSVQVWIEG